MMPSPIFTDEEKKDIQENKDMAAMSYVWIFSIVIYYARQHSPFVQFHAKQGMVLCALSIPLLFIPYIGNFLILPLVFGMMYGFIQAAHGERTDVPFIGRLSRGEVRWWKR